MKILLFLIFILALFFRLYGLNWDQGFHLHPDERLYTNASNISLPDSLDAFLSSNSPLNPKMFQYGSFPLFLYKAVHTTILPSLSFLIASRLISSLFSIFTIPLIFLIGKELFQRKIGLLAAFVFTFSAGSIQHAHFNTTENILVFFLTAIALLSIKAVKQNNYFFFIPLALLSGAAYATKIIGLTFLLLPGVSFLCLLFKARELKKIIFWVFLFILLGIASGFLSAPYQVIDYAEFKRQQEYMQGVIYGKYEAPFVIIYENTVPYFYQMIQVLPFAFGFISFPLAIIGIVFVIRDFLRKRAVRPIYLIIFLSYPLLYFLWSGAWYAKFARYSILLLPFLSILAAFALERLRKPFLIFFLALILINGALFLRIYQEPHTRIQASEWIYNNIGTGSIIAGEHWDDNLPLSLGKSDHIKQYTLLQLAVYDPDSQEKISKLAQNLSQSDYFIISSRRVYYSILKNRNKYPYTSRFYTLLFDGKLGFTLVKKFVNYPYFFSDDFADESFQSYDHPPVLIFKNEEKLPREQIRQLVIYSAL